MLNSVLTLTIKPDLNFIEIFNDEFTIPNESFTITGTVEINLIHPVQIRQLYIKFQGKSETILTSIDYFHEPVERQPYGDEIPIDKWETNANSLSVVERISRKTLGYAHVTSTIVNERDILISDPQDLKMGKTILPFSITVKDMHKLPPSIILPFHQIQYYLSARVKLNSLSERFKISYWNAKLSITHNNVKPTRHSENSQISSSPTDIMTPPQPSDMSLTTIDDENDTSLVSPSLITLNHGSSSNGLYTIHPIQVYQHSFPNLNSLHMLPRIRYRGTRKDRIKYEIGMTKLACLQKKLHNFTCIFNSLCPDSAIASIEYHLEQTELYPIRVGDYTGIQPNFTKDIMIERRRKFAYAKRDMSDYVNGSELKLNLSLNLPQISPSLEINVLKITHKLRMLVRFKNEAKERNMSLSFPLNVGTVPVSSHRQSVDSVHVRQELDEWLLTPDQNELLTSHYFDEINNKLPSYRDVLTEGYPPSPFLETSL